MSLFLRVPNSSLQGIAERPLPCNYYGIPSVIAFHGADAGSNPAGDAILSTSYR